MNKIFAAFQVFKKGQCVANPTAWKDGQITVAVLSGLFGALVGLAKAFNIDIPLTDDQLATIAGAVLAVTGLFIHPAVTIASSDKIGLPASDATNDEGNSPIPGH